jgi:hypothetical protein
MGTKFARSRAQQAAQRSKDRPLQLCPANSSSFVRIETDTAVVSECALKGRTIRVELLRLVGARHAPEMLTIIIPGVGGAGGNATAEFRSDRWDDGSLASVIDALTALRAAAADRGQR